MLASAKIGHGDDLATVAAPRHLDDRRSSRYLIRMSRQNTMDVPIQSGPDGAARTERVANRIAVGASITAAVAFVGGGILLWSREGLGVFLEVLAAGLSACF